MRFAAMVGKIRFPHRVNRWIGAEDVWNMVTRGSAGVLGMAEEIGTIEAGRKADLMLMKDDSVFLKPLNNFINALNYAETGADVDTVLVDGKVVMKKGRIITVDEERLRTRAQERIEQLHQGNAASWSVAERLSPFIAEACQKVVAMPFAINRYAASIESKP
jgi:cytosine/adenosine deaminase-related metal-dependent hydrolase